MSESLVASGDVSTADRDDLDHLEPEAQRAAFFSLERRLEYVKDRSPWIPYAEATEVLKQIEDIHNQPDQKKSKENLFIFGPTTMGLSNMVRQFEETVNTDPYLGRHAVVLLCPPYCNSRHEWLDCLSRSLKQRRNRGTIYAEFEDHVRHSLRLMGTRSLFVLDIHNLLDGKEKRQFVTQMRVFCEEQNLRLVMTSNEAPLAIVGLDEQLYQGTRKCALTGLKKDSIKELSAGWLRHMPNLSPSPVVEEPWVQDLLYTKYKYWPGGIGEAIKQAECSAIRRGSRNIDIEDLEVWRRSMKAATDAMTVPIKSPASSVRRQRETV